MDKNYEKLKETISEYEKNCKCVQALLFTMMSVEDPTKLKVWNKNLKTIMMDMNSSYTHLNLEMVGLKLFTFFSFFNFNFLPIITYF